MKVFEFFINIDALGMNKMVTGPHYCVTKIAPFPPHLLNTMATKLNCLWNIFESLSMCLLSSIIWSRYNVDKNFFFFFFCFSLDKTYCICFVNLAHKVCKTNKSSYFELRICPTLSRWLINFCCKDCNTNYMFPFLHGSINHSESFSVAEGLI